jgi:predicted transcriptional regulator
MGKRSKLEIIKDILVIVRDNRNLIKPTPLLRRSNISSSRFKEYYNDLESRGFVKEVHRKDGKYVSLTEKGERFLDKYQTIINFIEEFEI